MLIFSNGTAYFDQGTNGVEIDENGMPIIGNDFSLSAPCFIDIQVYYTTFFQKVNTFL